MEKEIEYSDKKILFFVYLERLNPLMQEVYKGATRIQATFNIIVNGQILAQYKRVYPSTDSVVYFYLEYLSSRRVVVDSSGTAIDRYRYSAWGEATQDTGTNDYRSFTGKDYDVTGLIYFNARYYDPVTGRFLTEDPAMKGISWYGYCENNPLINVDLTGRQSTTDQRKYNEGIEKRFDSISIARKQRLRDQALTQAPLVVGNMKSIKENKSNTLGRTVVINMPDWTWGPEEDYLVSQGYAQPKDEKELAKEIRIEYIKGLLGMAPEMKRLILTGGHGFPDYAAFVDIMATELKKENIDLPNDVQVYLLTCHQGKFEKDWAEAFRVPVENVHGIEGLANPFTALVTIIEHKQLGVSMEKSFSAKSSWDSFLEWLGIYIEK